MEKKTLYTREQLLDELNWYLTMIEASGDDYPVEVLKEIEQSIRSVLDCNNYKK